MPTPNLIRLINPARHIMFVDSFDSDLLPLLLDRGYVLHPTFEQAQDTDYWLRVARHEKAWRFGQKKYKPL